MVNDYPNAQWWYTAPWWKTVLPSFIPSCFETHVRLVTRIIAVVQMSGIWDTSPCIEQNRNVRYFKLNLHSSGAEWRPFPYYIHMDTTMKRSKRTSTSVPFANQKGREFLDCQKEGGKTLKTHPGKTKHNKTPHEKTYTTRHRISFQNIFFIHLQIWNNYALLSWERPEEVNYWELQATSGNCRRWGEVQHEKALSCRQSRKFARLFEKWTPGWLCTSFEKEAWYALNKIVNY